MKKNIFLFFIPLSVQLSAQPRHFLDSLKNDLITVTDDSLRFRVLDELAWTYQHVDADSALMYATLEIEAANKLKNEQFLSMCYSNIGVIKMNNYIEDFGIADLKKSLAINKKLNNQGGIASNTNNLGNSFKQLGKYDSAIMYYITSITIKLELGNEMSAASAMSNLGLVYMELDNAEKALNYFKEALKIVGESSRRSNGIFNNMGIAFSKLGQNDSARYFLKKALLNSALEGNESKFAQSYNNLAESFQDDQLYDSALFYASKSYQLKKKYSDPLSLTHSAITLSKIHGQLNNYALAKVYAQEATDIARQYENPERISEAIWFLGVAEANLKNFESAANLFHEYSKIKEELTKEKMMLAAEEAEAKFQNQLKEKENQLLIEEAIIRDQKIQTQNTYIISAIIVVILLIAIAFILRNQLNVRKKLNLQIEKQSQKLKELDQAKTRFFANISHDLRSPLTLILGSLDKITERDYDILDSESKEMLDMGMKNGKRLLYLADEIMDLTRLEEGKINLSLEYVKIVPYLRLLTKMFSSAADIKSISLKFEAKAEDESILQLDPHQFEKIIYNLLSNAIKFTPENGSVNVSIQSDNQHVEIEISDSGTGIPEESLDLIFDRYYQSSNTEHASQSGVGIGLALVKELVELHGGTITVSSSEKGTSFIAKFPFKENDWVSQAIVPERSLDVVTRNSLWMDLQEEHERIQVASLTNDSPDAKTVLIVEDHKELRFYLKSILSSDFRVFLSANGTHGLEVLQSEKIDLIITDLMMPYMDGFEFIDHLKNDKDLRKIPVLVVSARTDKGEKIELIKKGADDVISKPFDKDELFARISNILSRDWDSTVKLTKLYGETAEEFEKSIMAKMERLIIKRIDDPHLTVLDLADEMAASERKVYRMIKKISGLTPYELIKEVRWQYLKDYLKNNKVKTATEAANLIGMNNASSFSDQYKKRFGGSIKDVLTEN
jgi:signal transduction histidine kinase/CheY-like chemotaxis protein/AraC-like DNA-binding protein/Tfp pilus assembly protein PilF